MAEQKKQRAVIETTLRLDRYELALVAAQDVIAGMSGKRPQNLVNPDAFRSLP